MLQNLNLKFNLYTEKKKLISGHLELFKCVYEKLHLELALELSNFWREQLLYQNRLLEQPVLVHSIPEPGVGTTGSGSYNRFWYAA